MESDNNAYFIERGDDATHITLYEMLGAGVTIGICGLFSSDFTLNFPFELDDWIYVVILGTLCTAFAFLLGIYVMKEVSAYTVTMIKHKALGYTTGIVDLTRGELGTRGSAEIRDKEAQNSAKIMNLDIRENLGFADGFFEVSKENMLEIVYVNTSPIFY